MTMEVTKLWLTVKDVQRIYGLTYEQARRLRGQIQGFYEGRKYHFNALEVRRAYESGEMARMLDTRR